MKISKNGDVFGSIGIGGSLNEEFLFDKENADKHVDKNPYTAEAITPTFVLECSTKQGEGWHKVKQ